MIFFKKVYIGTIKQHYFVIILLQLNNIKSTECKKLCYNMKLCG